MKFPLIFLAVNLIGIEAALMLESRLGCDPIGLMCDGIAHALELRYGTACFIYNITIIGAALIVAKSDLGAGAAVYGLTLGFLSTSARPL